MRAGLAVLGMGVLCVGFMGAASAWAQTERYPLDNPADVCWYSSHHNFNDWAHAWSGRRHYDLKMARADHGVAPTYALHVFEQGPLDAASCPPTSEGTCRIGDAIELFPVNP